MDFFTAQPTITTPTIASVKQFFDGSTNHSGIWFEYLRNYSSIPARVKDQEKFIELDSWYHTLDLSNGYITQLELVKIMEWKLTRGKMRPLLKKIQALSNDEVQNATFSGLNHLKTEINEETIVAALDAICQPLNGVGPATASAILARYNFSIPFMSDAGLLAVNGKCDYKMKDYRQYYKGITTKVNQLNNDKQSNYLWTARDVEIVLHLVYSKSVIK